MCFAVAGNRVTPDSIAKVHKSRSELAGPITIMADIEPPPCDPDAYYRSVGRQNAMAFNRHAFNGRGARSVIRNQPF